MNITNTETRSFRITCDQRSAYVKLTGLTGVIGWFDKLDQAVDSIYTRFFDRISDEAYSIANGVADFDADEKAWRDAEAKAEAKIVDDIRQHRVYDDGDGRRWIIEEKGVDFDA